jgi:hypothetical protein
MHPATGLRFSLVRLLVASDLFRWPPTDTSIIVWSALGVDLQGGA